MAEKSTTYFKMPESQFKIYECYDLNMPTPRSSSRAQKKLFTCSSISSTSSSSSSFDKQEQNITWNDILTGKHPFSISAKGLITPPGSLKVSIEPVAPIKPRTSVRCMSKVELKPKKLIFNDIEESESEMDNLPSSAVFKVKFIDEDNANVQDNDHEQAGKSIGYDISSRSKGNRRKIVTDDKENCSEFFHVKNKTNLVKATSVSSLTQRPNLNVKGSLKLFRV